MTNKEKYLRLKLGEYAWHELVVYAYLTNPDPKEPLNPRRSRYQWKDHHYVIGRALAQLERREIKNLEIETPPRYSKSELAVRNFVTWHAGKHPDKDLLVITATAELAHEHGRDCRDYFNGSGYRLVFGGNPKCLLRSDSQSLDRLQLNGGAKIQFYGRGQIPAGVGGFGIVFDDFFKSSEEANSQTERDNAWRSYTADCLSRLNNSSSWILMIGSRKHEDDVAGRLFDETNPHYDATMASTFTRIRIPALSEGKEVDALKREAGEVCWPERFPKEFYLNKKNHKSDIVRIDFQTQDQCNPSPQEGTWFKKNWLQTYKRDELPKYLRFYVASDHAYREKEKNDSSCLLVVGVDSNGTIWVQPDTWWEKAQTDKMVDAMFNIINKPNRQIAMWWAARDAISGSLAPFIRKRMEATKQYFPIDDSIVEKRDLVARSASIRGMMALGLVKWPLDWPQWLEAEKQLLSFPSKRDDLVAALALLGMGMDRMSKADSPKISNLPVKGSFAWHSFGQDKKDEKELVAGWI